MTEVPLIPPDRNRCQAEKPNGHTFMTLGGRPGRIRCDSVPTVIVTEQRAGSDGRIGSMSLCDECWAVLRQQVSDDYARATAITFSRLETL